MKKLISLAMAIIMILSLTMVVFADNDDSLTDPPEETRPTSGTIGNVRGTITINDITVEDGKPVATYAIYQILKLNSYDFSSGSYDYDYTNDAWKEFFTNGIGKDYVNLNENGMLEWKGSTDTERVATFAKLALAFAKDPANNISATKTTVTAEGETRQYAVGENNTSIIFNDLELGYYLVDSTVGALCGLSTTNPDGLINSKNGAPTLEKQVQEDLGGQWGSVNTADIGQDVNFRITVHVHDGAQDYSIHDQMEEGLTFKPETVRVMVRDGSNTAENPVETVYQPTETVVVEDKEETFINYTIEEDEAEHSFEIVFTEYFCNKLNTNDRLIITYSAMLNRNAEIGNPTAENPAPNQNTAHMHYGEGHQTAPSSTTTKTYGVDLVKTNGQNQLLDGAEFIIYSEETGGYEITIVPLVDTNNEVVVTDDGYPMYCKARDNEAGQTIEVTNGVVRIVGLDNGTYWLQETKHPEGYNPLEKRQKFTIADNNLDAIISTGGIVSTNSGVHVVNHTGTMLPETGGLGTLLFTVLGGGTALGTGVVLVTKKRMSKIEDEE